MTDGLLSLRRRARSSQEPAPHRGRHPYRARMVVKPEPSARQALETVVRAGAGGRPCGVVAPPCCVLVGRSSAGVCSPGGGVRAGRGGHLVFVRALRRK
ncbi:hypothetical protein QJS66_01095 [Kocuria rhizophila]|nr:hypothetical protein QJS66_01095 [Kocuria rhizophila]